MYLANYQRHIHLLKIFHILNQLYNFQRCLCLTARQYGEVVLPDASTGQGPGTPRQRGQKTVTVQGGYGVVFAVRVQIF
jgi:hypothetical protein